MLLNAVLAGHADIGVNDGSAITEYTLTNTSTGESRKLGASEVATTWKSLENGTCYRFTLVATIPDEDNR